MKRVIVFSSILLVSGGCVRGMSRVGRLDLCKFVDGLKAIKGKLWIDKLFDSLRNTSSVVSQEEVISMLRQTVPPGKFGEETRFFNTFKKVNNKFVDVRGSRPTGRYEIDFSGTSITCDQVKKLLEFCSKYNILITCVRAYGCENFVPSDCGDSDESGTEFDFGFFTNDSSTEKQGSLSDSAL
ncbi:hypothetical protein KKA53_02635 [Candidatus Dependentiae bacterium]|nr:hypothetical protein [Candidatus Dependentiae bacterium]